MAASKKQLRDKVSKRVIGASLIGIAVIMGIITWYISFKTDIKDDYMALKIMEWFLISGCALLGTDEIARTIKKIRDSNKS